MKPDGKMCACETDTCLPIQDRPTQVHIQNGRDDLEIDLGWNTNSLSIQQVGSHISGGGSEGSAL